MIKKFFKETFRFIGALLALIKGIAFILMLCIAVISLYLIRTTATVTINQYNETLSWQNTAYDVPLSEINPVLVSNRVDTDVVTAAHAWESLESYVGSLDENGIQDQDTARQLLDDAIVWQEKYSLKSDAIERLRLYLEIEDAVPEAYETLDTEWLQSLAGSLHELELEEMTTAGQTYMSRISQVSDDFKNAKEMMEQTVASVGTFENGVWTIPYAVTREDLSSVLEQIQSMQKFKTMRNAADVLSDIADVLNSNKNAQEYFEYQEFYDNVIGLDRSQYVPVSSLYTYEQAIAYGCQIYEYPPDGYVISPSSPVTGVFYNGERLESNQYINRNAFSRIEAQITPMYDPVPEQTEEYYDDWTESGYYE